MDKMEHVKKHQKVIDFANIFKAFIGTNYLSLSYGFSRAGLGFSLIILVIVSGLTNHCCKLLVRCKHILVEDLCAKYKSLEEDLTEGSGEHHHSQTLCLRKRLQKNMDYADIGKLSLGKMGSVIVNVFLVLTQIGFCVGYMIFVGNMLHNFFPVAKGNGTLVNGTFEVSEWTSVIAEDNILMSHSIKQRMANFSEKLHNSQVGVSYASLNTSGDNFTETNTTYTNDRSSFKKLVHDLLNVESDSDAESSSELSLLVLVVLPLPIFVLFTMFRNVRQLGVVSVLANVSICIGFISVLGYIVIDFNISDDYRWFVLSTLPVYIAQVIGAYEAIGTIIPIEASMDNNKHKFNQTINIVVVGFTLLIAVLSSLGYLQYGSNTEQIIAENLPSESPVVILINVTLIIGVMCTYPLQIYPVVEIFENMIFAEGKCCGPAVKTHVDAVEDRPLLDGGDEDMDSPVSTLGLHVASYVPDSVPAWKRNLLRFTVAIFVTGLALFLRNVFAYVGAMVGAIGSCPLAFILPCLFHIKINRSRMSRLEILKDVTIIVFGIVCGVTGFIVTLMEIVKRI